jgi:hypothetical protein
MVRTSERINANKLVGLCEDKFVRRPVANKSATGLLGFAIKGFEAIKTYAKQYKKNITHTYDHKVIFALIEKELYGKKQGNGNLLYSKG